jgi:hypothetical protein
VYYNLNWFISSILDNEENKDFLRNNKMERIHYQQTWPTRNMKKISLRGKENDVVLYEKEKRWRRTN